MLVWLMVDCCRFPDGVFGGLWEVLPYRIIPFTLDLCNVFLWGGNSSNAISKLCADQATKNGSVDDSAEPLGAYLDEEIANK